MKIKPEIFKAYDVRGVYPEQINEETAYLIGRAFVLFLNKRSVKIAVGRDGRISSPAIFKSLVRGITDQGGDVMDIGLATSPMLYWASGRCNCTGGISITASHDTFEYNGFKFVREKVIPVSQASGLEEIKEIILTGNFNNQKKGKVFKKDILKEYMDYNLKPFKGVKPLRIVFDTANGTAGIVVKEFAKRTNHKVFHLFPEVDGYFPNHPPNPSIQQNIKTLISTVKEKKADLGVAFDGDGDRMIFIDEKGKVISGDMITALLAKLILKEAPQEKVLYDIRSSNSVAEVIKEAKGIPILWRIGHSFIKEKMRKDNILFGGELSGHYYHRTHYFCEAPIFVLMKIIKAITEEAEPLSALVKPFNRYFYSGEINFKIKNKDKALKELAKKFKQGKANKIDGLRVDFKDWWFLVRPANTAEPLLRLVVEAKSKTDLAKRVKELSAFIRKY